MIFKVIGRIAAGFFRNIGKFFYGISRNATKHPIGAILTLLVLVGVGVVLYATSIFGLADGNFLGGSRSSVVTPLERKLEPDGKSTEFLNALKDGKAEVMYNLLSDDYRKMLGQRGVNNAVDMQTLLDSKLEEVTKQKGTKAEYKFTYIIGTRYSDGSVDDNYSGTVQAKSGRGNFEFVFRINKGKITDIQTSEPVTAALLSGNKSPDEDKQDAQVGAFGRNSSPTAENFMVGLTTFDADKIWETLSDTYKEQLAQKKVTKDSIAKLFSDIKAGNTKDPKTTQTISYDGYVYQQTINFPNGVTANNYLSILSIQDTPRELGYIIVLDNKNKIVRLGNSGPEDPIMSAILGRARAQ